MNQLMNLGSVKRETKGSHINKNRDSANSAVLGKFVTKDTPCSSPTAFIVYNQSSDAVNLDLTPYKAC